MIVTAITRSQIPTITVGVNVLMTSGFSTVGDLGANATYTSVGATSGGPMAIQDASGAWYNLVINGPVNVSWCGVPNGSDDTTAIDLAFAIAAAKSTCVYFPAASYHYNGNGQDYNYIDVRGDGIAQSIITIMTSTKYLIDSNQEWVTFRFRDMEIYGGAGAIRNRYTGANVVYDKVVEGCLFTNFTGSAISTNSSNDPYWKIRRNAFIGSPSTSICIAFAGAQDSTVIENNDFYEYAVGIKIVFPQRVTLRSNSFIHQVSGTYRSDIWLVPYTTYSGIGYLDSFSTHGNETLNSTDYAYLFADEGTGTYVGDRFPVYTNSAGYLTGLTITNQFISGKTSPSRPLIYSTTPNIGQCVFSNVEITGSPPTYILQIQTPSVTDEPYSRDNVIGPVSMNYVWQTYTTFNFCNATGVATYVDPNNISSYNSQMVAPPLGVSVDTSTYANLVTASVAAWTHGGTGSSIAAATDVDGGADAATFNFTNATQNVGNVYAPATTYIANIPIQIEFDIAPFAGSALTHVVFEIASTVQIYYFTIPATTKRVFLTWTPRAGTTQYPAFTNITGETGKVTIGRFRMYQAMLRAPGNILKGPQYIENALTTPATPTGGGYLWVDSSGNLKYVSPGGKTTTIATNT